MTVRWKNLTVTFAAIGEVGAAMVRQFKQPRSMPEKSQGLQLLLLSASANYGQDVYTSLLLAPFGCENWERFPSIAMDVTKNLLSELYALTAVRALPCTGGRKSEYAPVRSRQEYFLYTYVKMLQLHDVANGVYYQYPDMLITETYGANIPLSTLVISGDYGPGMDYHAYGFLTPFSAHDFTQAKQTIEKVPHALHLGYERYPDTLEIHIDTELLSLSQCLTQIRKVCVEGSIPLKIDPALESQMY